MSKIVLQHYRHFGDMPTCGRQVRSLQQRSCRDGILLVCDPQADMLPLGHMRSNYSCAPFKAFGVSYGRVENQAF
jgi:hypothetical protein